MEGHVDLDEGGTDLVGVVQVGDAEFGLDGLGAVLGEEYVAPLGIGLVVPPRAQLAHRGQDLPRRRLPGGGPRQHQRNESLVHQHRVGLVHEGHVRRRGDEVRRVGHQLLAEDVETDLRDRAVCDIAAVGVTPFIACRGFGDVADRQSQQLEHRAHPAGVPGGEVVVDGDDVDGVSLEGVPRRRHRPGEGLALARRHLHDVAGEHAQRALELDVERPQPHRPVGGLPGQCEEAGEVLGRIPEELQVVRRVRELAVVQSRRPPVVLVRGLDRALRARGVASLGGAHELPEAVGQSHAWSPSRSRTDASTVRRRDAGGDVPRRSRRLALRVDLAPQPPHGLRREHAIPRPGREILRHHVRR